MPAGSNPVVGSSRKSSSGSPASATGDVEPPLLPAGELARPALSRFCGEADHLDDLVERTWMRVVARGTSRWSPRRSGNGSTPVFCRTMPMRSFSDALALRGVVAQDDHLAAVARAVALEDLDGGGLAGAVGAEEREHLARRDRSGRSRATASSVAVGLAKAPDLDRRLGHGRLLCYRGLRPANPVSGSCQWVTRSSPSCQQRYTTRPSRLGGEVHQPGLRVAHDDALLGEPLHVLLQACRGLERTRRSRGPRRCRAAPSRTRSPRANTTWRASRMRSRAAPTSPSIAFGLLHREQPLLAHADSSNSGSSSMDVIRAPAASV